MVFHVTNSQPANQPGVPVTMTKQQRRASLSPRPYTTRKVQSESHHFSFLRALPTVRMNWRSIVSTFQWEIPMLCCYSSDRETGTRRRAAVCDHLSIFAPPAIHASPVSIYIAHRQMLLGIINRPTRDPGWRHTQQEPR